MSYQVLARKWRPYQFGDVVGQSHVLKALCNALDHNRLHHAYLFSGTRGVGKTTIARIFAKGLNCEQGVSAKPCGQCPSCIEIEQGRCVDLLEIDAASRTKVEDTREILDNVQYKPARCRFKIYLIDEVHMLSRSSFNALLKTLEEPPEYVKFILATTDPQKLPITILSRCLQFHLKHLQPEQIKEQLAHILNKEQINAQTRALSLLAHAADGSMRDALSLTDQAIALGGGEIMSAQVSEMLGTINTDQALILIEAITKSNAKHLFQVLAQLSDIGMEWDNLLKELALQFHRIALAQMLEESIDKTAPDAQRLLALAQQLEPQDVQLYYQIILQGRQDLPYAATAKSGFEMVLMRLLAFKPVEILPIPISGLGSERQSQNNLSPLTAAVKANDDANQAQSAPVTQSVNAQLATTQHSMPQQSMAQKSVTQQSMPQQLMPQHLIPKSDNTPKKIATERDDKPHYHEQLPQNTKVNTIAMQSIPESTLPSSPVNSLVAARSLLRNKLKQDSTPSQNRTTSNLVKKSDPNLFTSHLLSLPCSQSMNNVNNVEKLTVNNENKTVQKQEEYRWQSSVSLPTETEQSVSPEKIKTILSHDRTQEMRKKLELEAEQKDDWSRLVGTLAISQMSKQLALNAAMEQKGTEVNLFLRHTQSHLNTEKNKAELTRALTEQLGDLTLIVLLDDSKGVTPLEWRDKLYTEKLAQAVKTLNADSNIRFICQRYAAILDEDSIRPI